MPQSGTVYLHALKVIGFLQPHIRKVFLRLLWTKKCQVNVFTPESIISRILQQHIQDFNQWGKKFTHNIKVKMRHVHLYYD